MSQAQAVKKKQAALNTGFFEKITFVVRLSLFCFAVLVVLMALAALLTHSPLDPAWTNATANTDINNVLGVVGAYFSDFSLLLFGQTSFVIPFVLLICAYQLFMSTKQYRFDIDTIGIKLISLIVFFILLAGVLEICFQGNAGGVIGKLVGRELPVNLMQTFFFMNQTILWYVIIGFIVSSMLLSLIILTGTMPIYWIDKVGAIVLEVIHWAQRLGARWQSHDIEDELTDELAEEKPRQAIYRQSMTQSTPTEIAKRSSLPAEDSTSPVHANISPQFNQNLDQPDLDIDIQAPVTDQENVKVAIQHVAHSIIHHHLASERSAQPQTASFIVSSGEGLRKISHQQEYGQHHAAPILTPVKTQPITEQTSLNTQPHHNNDLLTKWQKNIQLATTQNNSLQASIEISKSNAINIVAGQDASSQRSQKRRLNTRMQFNAPTSESNTVIPTSEKKLESLSVNVATPSVEALQQEYHALKLQSLQNITTTQTNQFESLQDEALQADYLSFIEEDELPLFEQQSAQTKLQKVRLSDSHETSIIPPSTKNISQRVEPKFTGLNTPDERQSDAKKKLSMHSERLFGADVARLDPQLPVLDRQHQSIQNQTANKVSALSNNAHKVTSHWSEYSTDLDKMTTLDMASEPLSLSSDTTSHVQSLRPHHASKSELRDTVVQMIEGLEIDPRSGATMLRKRRLFPYAGHLPSLDLLTVPSVQHNAYDKQELAELATLIELNLKHFGIQVNVVNIEPGPVITRFDLDLAPGVKVSQISNLDKDLARGLSVTRLRVVDIIPGKPYVGLEIPNRQREMVYFREGLESHDYQQNQHPLTLVLGKNTAGEPVIANLAKMPHLLVAGTTGSGKSVGVNTMLLSMLFKAYPEQLRLILIDPKMLELANYNDIPHLLTPVITDMKDAANALRWCVSEMERRYLLMSKLKVRGFDSYNQMVKQAISAGQPLQDPLWKREEHVSDLQDPPLLKPFAYIVVVIDEFADLMMQVGKACEELIARLAQKARASGIHLIVATQRPSADILTGIIKANIPTRIAFQVSSKIDSRVVLEQHGAESLLGHGDMLYLAPGMGQVARVHGAFVSEQEVNAVVDFLKLTGEPDYIDDITQEPNEAIPGLSVEAAGVQTNGQDPLYEEAMRFILDTKKTSVSALQRRLKIGFNRAANLMEELEQNGVVSEVINGNREILINHSEHYSE